MLKWPGRARERNPRILLIGRRGRFPQPVVHLVGFSPYFRNKPASGSLLDIHGSGKNPMVDTPPPNAETPGAENRQKKLERPVASPRKKTPNGNRTVRNRGSKVAGHTRGKSSDHTDQASTMVSKATRGLRAQAHGVSGAARDNPGTTTSILGVIGVLGFLLGMLVGRALTDNTRHRWY